MFTDDSAAVRAAILAGTIQQVQAEPIRRAATVRGASVRGSLARGGSGAGGHHRVY
ncbi:hypothetical protein [Micropruina sp.]|uniref:hypothetical protein n=1 Tax=Micropruina sp. TaxID=2737536 RepID=UPI0039E37B99